LIVQVSFCCCFWTLVSESFFIGGSFLECLSVLLDH
jgi:hypothetical protein